MENCLNHGHAHLTANSVGDVWRRLAPVGALALLSLEAVVGPGAAQQYPAVYFPLVEPQDLTIRQGAKLASIAATNRRLYRAYLLKEQLRRVFASERR